MTDLHTLIIGIGNRYRGDDAFGCLVAGEIAGRLPPGAKAMEHDGEPAGLMECWQQAGRVILVDAVSSGAEPGTILRFDLAEKSLPEAVNLYSTHAFGVPQAVEMARALGNLPPEISFIGVEGENFGAGEALSHPLLRVKDAVISEILNTISAKESKYA